MNTHVDPDVLEEFRHFSEEELEQIKSDLNIWGTGIEFHEKPDMVHAAVHYSRAADGSLYCKYPRVREVAGDKKVFPNEEIYNAVQIWFAICYYEDYIASHSDGIPVTLTIPEYLPHEQRQRYIVMMLFILEGQAAAFSSQYTCPERLLGIRTEELKCQQV